MEITVKYYNVLVPSQQAMPLLVEHQHHSVCARIKPALTHTHARVHQRNIDVQGTAI